MRERSLLRSSRSRGLHGEICSSTCTYTHAREYVCYILLLLYNVYLYLFSYLLFLQDCDGDGNINCYDFLRIHRFGGYGCSGSLDSKYENTYKLCMQTFSKQ